MEPARGLKGPNHAQGLAGLVVTAAVFSGATAASGVVGDSGCGSRPPTSPGTSAAQTIVSGGAIRACRVHVSPELLAARQPAG